MSMGNGRDFEDEQRQVSLFGRYSLDARTGRSAPRRLSRDAPGLFRLQDFRIGVQRRF